MCKEKKKEKTHKPSQSHFSFVLVAFVSVQIYYLFMFF